MTPNEAEREALNLAKNTIMQLQREYSIPAADWIERVLERIDRALSPTARATEPLRAALLDYMAAFGQALEAHGIAYGPQQDAADKAARAALGEKTPTQEKA